MAEEQAKGAGGLPAAMVQSRLLLLPASGKTVEVRRWNFIRLATVSAYMNEIMASLPDDVDVNTLGALRVFFQTGPQKMLEVAKLSVLPDQRTMLDEADYEDVFAVLEAALAINEAKGALGKMTRLAGQFLVGKMTAMPNQDDETKAAPPEVLLKT